MKGTSLLNLLCLGFTAVLSYSCFSCVGLSETPIYIPFYTWMTSGLFQVDWAFQIDSLTIVMFLLVTTVSTLVYCYSISYMLTDPHFIRFSAYIAYFVFAMLILVSSNNFVQLFFGWELVGIMSYLLISFWYTILQANKSAIQAVLFNKVGDIAILIAIAAMFAVFQAVDFETVFSLSNFYCQTFFQFGTYSVDVLSTICFFLFIGAVGKSAQLGLHLWLPSAMTGPTPVSALIHAATMVTAGIFLIIRCSVLFEQVESILVFITLVGSITAFFAATVGLVQNDVKKTIAYSTASQLGYMAFACGLSHYHIAMFHLYTHGFFKALLFLCAGSVIHGMSDEQAVTRMGGLSKLMPVTYVCMLVGSLSLMGFPFLAGFYSKDSILEIAAVSYSISGTFAYWLGLGAAFCTAFYSFRLLYFTFWAATNTHKVVIQQAHESGPFILFPLTVLCLGAIFVGYLFKDLFIGVGSTFFGNAIYVSPAHYQVINAEFLPTSVKLIPLFLSLFGAIGAVVLYSQFSSLTIQFKHSFLGLTVYRFLNQKWYFDLLMNRLIALPVLNFGYHVSFKLIDKGWIELFGPFGISQLVYHLSHSISKLASGLIHHSVMFMILGMLVLFVFIAHVEIIGFLVVTKLYSLILCLLPLMLILNTR